MHPPRSVARRRRTRIVLAVVAVVVVTTSATSAPISAAGRQQAAPTALSGPGSKLSGRLQRLVQPDVRAMSGVGRSRAVGLADSGAGSLMTRPGGRFVVRIRLSDTSAATLDAVRATGATDLSVSAPDALANATVSPDGLAALVAVAGVAAVGEEITPMVGSPAAARAIGPTTSSFTCPTPTGIVTEGDVQLKANLARANFSVNGAGVKVGILSDSFNALGGAPTDVASAELPGATNPCGFPTPVQVQADSSATGMQDEGRAMAQIVHDLAPGSSLAFATAFNGIVDFANQIRNLRTNGASVIVDDVTYYSEPMFQDGIIARAVDDVVASGALFYSSAANNTFAPGGRDVSSYETAAFRPTACPASINTWEGVASQCHNFNDGGVADNGDTITLNNNKTATFALSYSQAQGGVTTDLDFFLIDAGTGALKALSADRNVLSTQDPSEVLQYKNISGGPQSLRLVVARYQGLNGGDAAMPRFKFVAFTNGDTGIFGSFQYVANTTNDTIGSSIVGHNAATRAATVAAVPYDNSTVVEYFSSHGPVAKCWGPTNGTGPPYLPPAAAISPCSAKTVDFAATDGGQNSFFPPGSPSPHRFYGTSAAAPHAAAVGALAMAKFPCRSPDEILAAQRSSATAMAYPADVAGAGLVNADAMLGALAPCRSTLLFHPLASPARILDSRPPPSQVGPYSTPWGPGTSRDLLVGGSGTAPVVPAGATSVVLNVTVTNTTGFGFLTLWPTGQPRPTVSSLNWAPGVTIANAVTVKLGSSGTQPADLGKLSIFNSWGDADVVIDVAGYYDLVSVDGFTSVPPARILDSRPPPSQVGPYSTPWGAGTSRDLLVGSAAPGSVVPQGADAVVLNVTVTNTTGSGFLTLWPTGQPRPTASNLNWTPGVTIANAVTVTLGSGSNVGSLSIFNSWGDADVVIDVAGYYAPGWGKAFHALDPVRTLDSRPPPSQVGPYSTPWGAGFQRDALIGVVPLPPAADSVVLNVTVTDTTGSSFLTLWPTGQPRPTASNLNWTPWVTRPNAVTVKLGASGPGTGMVSVFNSWGTVDVVIDVAGWFG